VSNGRTFSAHTQTLFIILYCLLKMSHGKNVPDPEPELINGKNLTFAKPKLFFKNIRCYDATSTYIHVQIPLNFSQILDTQQSIAGTYRQLLDKHDEPFKSIAKSTTDVSLMTIGAIMEDFKDIIRAFPQTTEITAPG
jgi:hypothetical protein